MDHSEARSCDGNARRGTAEWLESIGLGEYAQRFADSAVDLSTLRDLTDQDLKELGVLLGHRRKILRAIAELGETTVIAPAAPATEPEPEPPDEGERRHLTVMFCDLVGSTALSARLDPEDMRRVIASYHACIGEVISRYKGMIARYMGDGVLAYFGYPVAQEDNAEQAVRAALAIVDAVANLRTGVSAALQARIGIATGTVVVSELLIDETPTEQAVVGETPNLAARLQTLAEPGAVLIGPSTRQLTAGNFDYRNLGAHMLKGWAEPIPVWQVVGTSGVESRFEATHTAKLPPLIGREEEIDLLLRRWRHATQEEGRVVVLTGEPGIGKSHIARALDERLQSESHITLRYFCFAHHTNSALFPFINQLKRAAEFKRSDTPMEKLSKLDALLAQSTADPEHVAVLANLLAVPVSDRYRLQDLIPQKRKEKTLTALLAQLDGLAARQPVFIIFEDVHWIDPTSLELLAAIVELVPQLRVLLLVTARPEFTPPWPSYPHLTTISLTRLGRRDGAALVQRVTGGKTLPKEVMDQILAHTDGVPLFIEELTKMVLEGGLLRERDGAYVLEGPLPPLAIPTTLQASLIARLDRLSPAVREVAQIGAVAGRDFHYDLLNAVAGWPRERLEEALEKLVWSELVFRRGEIPHAVYTFKHALVRDAAYVGLLKSRRVHLHAAIANALEQEFPEVVQTQPEIVAYHYTQAGSYEKALHYWYEAGKQSAARSAHNEAVGHLKQGLKQIPNIDDPMLRNKSELLLQTSLGKSLRAIEGWSTDSVKHAYTRALQLCKETGLDEHTFPAVFGLWTWNFLRASLGEAQALAEQLLSTAENVDDPVRKVLAHEALGFTLFAQGKFAAAHAELERSISMCEDSAAAAYLDLSAQDPRVHVRLYDGMALWFLGYPDQALRICAEARRYADASQHPFSEAIARAISLRVHQLRGEAVIVAGQVNAAIALCEEHEFGHYLAMALILRGWASAQQGEFEKGIAEIQEGLEKERATGALLYESYTLGLMADACIKNERYGRALEFLDQAQLRLDEENSERFYAAEIYRLLGETHLRSNQNLDQAEHCFSKGLKVAREQKAKSLELKLCTSIYDLYELRQNADKYRSQLGEIYGSFSEGFSTPDLVRAKARLKIA
jgi:class 3 adenylate cyclase/predicted ATPase